jgi:hypothetical protein
MCHNLVTREAPVTLASFNAAPEQEAVNAMLACCASHRFAAAMTAGRPYASQTAALDAVAWPGRTCLRP